MAALELSGNQRTRVVDGSAVVWWSLVLGGLLGAVCKSLLAARIELPYASKLGETGQIIVVPGILGDLVLGPVAAMVLLGASASTFSFQTAYDAQGFWAPFISSIIAGIGAAQLLRNQVEERLDKVEASLLGRAEAGSASGE